MDPVKLEVYDFGEHSVWPKPELKTPFEAMHAVQSLQDRLKRLPDYAKVGCRLDHFIRDLDTLQFSLKEALFESMVIREALTGRKMEEKR